ncbi:MAG: HAD family hydrolase [Vulcanisaeta sp.]
MKYISFDIDGVLVNSERRLKLCIKPNNEVDWDCFLDCNKLYLDKPKPRIIDFLNFIKDRGFGIIIVTGRRESMRECTIRQLNMYGIYGFEEIFMRPDDNTETDPVYKSWMMKNVLKKFKVLVHFDDNPNTVSALKGTGIDAVVLS